MHKTEQKEHGGGKNDRRHDSCVSNFSRDVHRTTYSLFRELTDIPISNHWTRRANDLNNQTLRLSHSDDHGPKPTWWHKSSRSSAGRRIYMRFDAYRFPSTKIFASRENWRQSWRLGKRSSNANEHSDNGTSNHVLTRTEIHIHTKHKTLSCKRFLPTWRCGHHIVAPQHKSQHGSTNPHAQTPKSPIPGQQCWSCPFLNNVRESRNLLAIMAVWPNNSIVGEHSDKDTCQVTY